jgi:putative ABC transport system ATP-binding protein
VTTRALIHVENVTRTFGEGAAAFQALRGVSFDVEQREFVAVMGASGSGKSTMMNILGCLDTATSGRFLFSDVEVQSLDNIQRAMLRRRYIGFVFQGFNLLSRTTALENVEMPLLYRGEPLAQRRAAAMQALERVGLGPWAKHAPNQLSGGQQQRVAIARAIVTRPELLLADEPTGNLDSERSLEIMSLLTELNRDLGVTIVMITHEPEMAAFASTVIRFRDGLVEGREVN